MATVAPQEPNRRHSLLGKKIRQSFRPSALRGLLEHSDNKENANPEKHEKQQQSGDGKRQSMEETSWISRKRRKNKTVKEEEPKHVLGDLTIDVGGFEEFKSTLDPGRKSMYSLMSPDGLVSPMTTATATTTTTKKTVLTVKPEEKPLMQKLNQYSPKKMTCELCM